MNARIFIVPAVADDGRIVTIHCRLYRADSFAIILFAERRSLKHKIFCFGVERLRVNKKVSKITLKVADYIQHHLSETITTKDIAQRLFISRTHLSKKFKDETGENLIDFILKEKTEEAKRLLCYTDKSLNAISNYLSFSSQSHFTRVFKKYSGNTPNEYRQRYNN